MSSDPSNLPDYVCTILVRVIRSTSYRVAIEEVDLLEFDSEVRYASPDAPIHHIRVSRNFRSHRTHFILSSLAKIERFFTAASDQRRLPVVDIHGRLSKDEEFELGRRVPAMTAPFVAEMSNRLSVGLARQVLSFPLDLRVEREIYQEMPEHHELQLAYLNQQVADIDPHFGPAIQAMSPPKAYAASSAMNCAFADFCAEVTGNRSSRGIRYSPHRNEGLRLLALLEQLRGIPGHVGDRRAQDAWAQALGLRDLYEWSPA